MRIVGPIESQRTARGSQATADGIELLNIGHGEI
jgi:hypothetical protein